MILSNGTEIKEYRMTNGATEAVVVSEDRRGMTCAEWAEYNSYLKGLSLEESRARLANRLPPLTPAWFEVHPDSTVTVE